MNNAYNFDTYFMILGMQRRQILLCCVCVTDDNNIIMIARSSCCTRYSDIIIIIIRSVRHQLSSLFRLIIVVAMLYWQQQTSEDRTHTTVYTTMYVHGVTHIITTRKYTGRTFHYYCRNYIIIATACNIFFTSPYTRGRIFRLYRTTSRERGEDARENLATRVDRCTRDDCLTILCSVTYNVILCTCCLSYKIMYTIICEYR